MGVLAAWTALEQHAGRSLAPDRNHDVECPAHEDNRESLSAKYDTAERKVLLHCFAGCETSDVAKAMGLTISDLFDQRRNGDRPVEKKIVQEYPYCDERGEIAHVTIRYAPKGFRQKRPDGNGGWVWSLEGARRVCYHLDKLQGQPIVVLVEGEKDADALWEIEVPATTTPMGSAAWRDEYAQQLVSAGITSLVILPDNDDAGRKYAQAAAAACHAAGVKVRMVALPGVPEKGDVSDWLREPGHDQDALIALIEQAPMWEPITEAEAEAKVERIDDDPDSKPTILISGRDDVDDINQEAFALLASLNKQSPEIFRRGPNLVRVRADAENLLFIDQVYDAALAGHLERLIRWIGIKRVLDGKKPDGSAKYKQIEASMHPPAVVVKNILSRASWDGIPPLRVLTSVPVFSKNGTLITTPGYHPDSGLWYAPDRDLILPVPSHPTPAQIAAARSLFMDDLLVNFPFDSEASRANTLAAILMLFVREIIAGCTPLHLFDAPSPGIGKGLLIELIGIIVLGVPPNMGGFPKEDDEVRKQITSALLSGTPIITLDNIARPLRSADLARALTSEFYTDRALGISEMKRLPNRVLWLASGNNVSMLTDMARRTVSIRLDQRTERPWERKDDEFKHPSLKEWATEHRGELVTAALTLCRAWLDAGRPTAPHRPIGGFRGWADVMAGILAVAGVEGFLENHGDVATQVDDDVDDWKVMAAAWWAAHQGAEVTAKDLLGIAKDKGLFAVAEAPAEKQLAKLARLLGRMAGRIVPGFKVHRAQHSKAGRRFLLEQLPLEPPVTMVTSPPAGSESPKAKPDTFIFGDQPVAGGDVTCVTGPAEEVIV